MNFLIILKKNLKTKIILKKKNAESSNDVKESDL